MVARPCTNSMRRSTAYGAGERPRKDAEPTTEQLAAICHLLDNGLPPFADFAVFGPHGHRLERKLKLSKMSSDRLSFVALRTFLMEC